MNVEFTSDIKKELFKIKKKDPRLFKNIQKKLEIFKINPTHPALRLHKLKGKLSNSWSISIKRNFRLVYFKDDDTAVFYKMGTHEEVYN